MQTGENQFPVPFIAHQTITGPYAPDAALETYFWPLYVYTNLNLYVNFSVAN